MELGGDTLMFTHQLLPPAAHSKPAAPEKQLHMLCSMLPPIVTVYNKVQELSGNLLDHLKSCILSCNMLYLTLISCTYGSGSWDQLLQTSGSMMQLKTKYVRAHYYTHYISCCAYIFINISTCNPTHHTYLCAVISCNFGNANSQNPFCPLLKFTVEIPVTWISMPLECAATHFLLLFCHLYSPEPIPDLVMASKSPYKIHYFVLQA